MKKLFFVLLCAAICQNAMADVYGKLSVSNCYQLVYGSLTGTSTFNFLDAPEGRTVTMGSNNPLDILNVDIFYLDASGVWNTLYTGLPLGMPYIIGSAYPIVKFVPNNNPGSFGSTAQPVIINYVAPSMAPTSSSSGSGCITFGSNNFRLNLNLDGLCNPPYFKITLPPSAPNRWGIPNNWFIDGYDGATSTSINVPISHEFCAQQILDINGNIVSPCMNFNVEIVLEPCYPNNNNCPNYTFNQTLQVCCFCGTYNPTED